MDFPTVFKNHIGYSFLAQTTIVQSRQKEYNVLGLILPFMGVWHYCELYTAYSRQSTSRKKRKLEDSK